MDIILIIIERNKISSMKTDFIAYYIKIRIQMQYMASKGWWVKTFL